MLKLFDNIQKSMVRNHMKKQRKEGVNEVASAYVERLTKGRTVPTTKVISVFDRKLNQMKGR